MYLVTERQVNKRQGMNSPDKKLTIFNECLFFDFRENISETC